MRVQIDMPQLGESIVEGTIVEWHKKVGDQVREDEELFTITTDKVDTEVPAPQAGVLVEIIAEADETVEVGQAVAVIDTAAQAGASNDSAPEDSASEDTAAAAAPAPTPVRPKRAVEADEDTPRVAMSPVARKMLEEAGVESAPDIDGSGVQGRILKQDVEAYLAQQAEAPDTAPAAKGSASDDKSSLVHPQPRTSPTSASVAQIKAPPIMTAAYDAVPESPPHGGRPPDSKKRGGTRIMQQRPHRASKFDLPIVQTGRGGRAPQIQVGKADRVEPMSRSRVSIARNLSRARRNAVHCSTVWEADVTDMIEARKELKKNYARSGVHLTYTAFFIAAISKALQEVPVLNAATDGENVVYRGNVNIGVASAWRDGMVVPTIKRANTLSLLGLARVVNDIQRRTEEGELRPTDLGQATFTLTNGGIMGARYGVPTLFPPQVGIVSIGTIAKRVVVGEGDSLRVRSMVELSLTFDHRVVDFNDADGFMKHLVDYLERSEW